ncbi:MAG TPA: ABC transporter substrate-binding protein [Bauldia sp.]|nr:ABC transporter substrate-binding protein [Bauldia sp.]
MAASAAGMAGTYLLGLRPIPAFAQPENLTSEPQTLVIGWASGPNGYDGEFNNTFRSMDVYRNASSHASKFNPLAVGDAFQDNFAELVPAEAESVEISPDWTSLTITLKSGVLSPTGNELTTDDVLYKFKRHWALKGNGWGFIKDAMLLNEDSVTANDRYTYTIKMTGPNAIAGIIQAHGGARIADSVEALKHATADDPWSTKWYGSNYAGHGPWQLVESVAGESWTMTRNPNYYAPDAFTGNVTKVINRVIPSSASRVALLQAGAIDMAFDLQSSELMQLKNASGVRVDSLAGNFLQWLGFSFNKETSAPLRDLKVRQAIALALPFDQLLQRPYLGLAEQMKSTVAPAYAGYDQTSTVWTRQTDLAAAKTLMAESAYPNGFKTTLHYDIGQVGQEETAIIIKAALEQLNIETELVKLQTGDYFNIAFSLDKGFPGLFIYKDMAGTPDVNFGTHLWLKSGHCCSPGGYANPDIDILYAEAQANPHDFALRVDRQKQIDNIAINQDPMGVPMQALGFHVASRENVGGFWWHSLNEITWDKAWKA